MNINIHIPDDLHKQLKLEAIKHDKTLRALILYHLEQETKQLVLPRRKRIT